MAQVKLKIEVNPNAETEKIGDITNKVNDVGSTSNLSNVSIKAKDNGMFIVKEMNNNGRELLSFGESGSLKFTQDGYLTSNGITKGELASEQNPDMFVWGVVPSNKQYSVKLTFTNAQNLKDIVVYGDKVSNQFPIEAIIDNKKVIYSNDYRWAINLGVESDTHTIEFTKWNRGDYNACLTLIRVMLRYFEISNTSGLIELESLSQSNSQPKEIYYGLIPNTGSASVNDNYGEINDLINEEIITNSMNNIEIYIDNQKIQHHITTDSDYEDGKVFTMEFENSLSYLETKYAGRNLTDSMSAYDLLCEVFSTLNYTNEKIDSMLSEEIIYGDNEMGSVKSYLEKITIEYPYLASSTYRETLNKFCTLAQLNLMEDDYGNLKFVSARPIDIDSKPIIVIPTNRQFSRLVKDEFLKNKYKKVYIGKNKYVGEYQLFGETKSVTFLEEKSESEKGTLSDGTVYTYSDYDEIYSNKEKNIYADVTTKETKTSTGLIIDGYKVTGIKLPISKEYILRNIDTLYLNVKMDVKNRATAINESGSVVSTSKWKGTKSVNFTWKLDENYKDGVNHSYIENVNIEEEYVTFDLFCPNSIYADGSGTTVMYAESYPLNVTLQLYGNVYKIEEVSSSESFDIEISSNELITDYNKYNNIKILNELNKNNIIVDYTKGIRTANITIACLDYYDTKGNKVIDWSKNQIIKVGQIVRIDKDNLGNSKVNYLDGEPYLWKVTGRRFRYNGIGMLDLELQEVKFNSYYLINETIGSYASVKYTRISSEYGASIGEITSKDILYPNDVIKIDVSFQDNDIYYMGDTYVNGNKFTSGDTITIKKPLIVVVNSILKTFTIDSTIGEGATLILKRESSPNGKGNIGLVDVNSTFYYGDVLIIDWDLSGSYEVRDAYFNDTRLYTAGTNRVTITKNSILNIPTIKFGWTTLWEGNVEYNMLENNGTDSEIVLDLKPILDYEISFQQQPVVFTFERITCRYGDLSQPFYNLNGFDGFDMVYNLGETLWAGDLEGTGSFNVEPFIRINLDSSNGYPTRYIRIERDIGNYGGKNCIFSEFVLVKIQQYISN